MNKPKVYVIIGISHSGKSSFVRNTFIRGRIPELKRDLMPYSELDDCCLIGRYDTGEKRRDGTDSIERKMVGVLAQQVINLSSSGKSIVLEGMRCISRPMMNSLLDNGFHPILIWLKCSVETSVERNNAYGTEVKDVHRLSSRDDKKCKNFVRDYTGKIDIKVIETDDVDDFSRFKMEI